MEKDRKPSQEIQRTTELGDMRPKSTEGIQLQPGELVELRFTRMKNNNFGIFGDPN